MKQLETERLILRRFEASDSAGMFEYARDVNVGPNAGWRPHQDEEESRETITLFQSSNENYAIVLKSENKVIGGIGLHESPLKHKKSKEIGYVLNSKYWGQGIVPEAVEEIKRFGFIDLQLENIWCGHFDYNERSKRVNEKCHFVYQYTKSETLENFDNKKVKTLFYKIDREDYVQ